MATSLNIRDIGQDRKKAIENEAETSGSSIADVVRKWIDAGIESSRAERERAEWVASAKQGLEDEARHLEAHGPSLSRFRSF